MRTAAAGGRITVSAHLAGDGALALKVTDTGIGIPSDELASVTEPFVQGGLAVRRNQAGAGLGLTMAKRLVELHGGQLDIASKLQEGTTVTMRFPPARLVMPSAEHAEWVG